MIVLNPSVEMSSSCIVGWVWKICKWECELGILLYWPHIIDSSEGLLFNAAKLLIFFDINNSKWEKKRTFADICGQMRTVPKIKFVSLQRDLWNNGMIRKKSFERCGCWRIGCFVLLSATCESQLSHLSDTNTKRTSRMCYTFQREKVLPWRKKKGKARKNCSTKHKPERLTRTQAGAWAPVKHVPMLQRWRRDRN